MHQFFNTFSSTKDSQFFYKELIVIYDGWKFNSTRALVIENFLFKTLRDYELKSSFLLRQFDILLNYLGIIASSPAQISQGNFNDSDHLDRRY